MQEESCFVDVLTVSDEFDDEFEDMSHKRRSEVWKHFLQSSTRKEYVKCRHCDKIMVQARGNNTSALMKHLRAKKHNLIFWSVAGLPVWSFGTWLWRRQSRPEPKKLCLETLFVQQNFRQVQMQTLQICGEKSSRKHQKFTRPS